MTKTAAMAKSLLNGEVLSIMTGFQHFMITNIPREISRQIEKKFGVKVAKTPTKFKSKYGKPGVYFKYRLPMTDYNKVGVAKMREYIKDHSEK